MRQNGKKKNLDQKTCDSHHQCRPSRSCLHRGRLPIDGHTIIEAVLVKISPGTIFVPNKSLLAFFLFTEKLQTGPRSRGGRKVGAETQALATTNRFCFSQRTPKKQNAPETCIPPAAPDTSQRSLWVVHLRTQRQNKLHLGFSNSCNRQNVQDGMTVTEMFLKSKIPPR